MGVCTHIHTNSTAENSLGEPKILKDYWWICGIMILNILFVSCILIFRNGQTVFFFSEKRLKIPTKKYILGWERTVLFSPRQFSLDVLHCMF